MPALSPKPMQGRGMLKKPPRVRDNNGALQVRLRLDGRDYFINRLGRFDDPVAEARGQAICAEIWRDAQQGDLDLSLNRYRPLVEGRDQDLLDALRSLAEEKKQARVTHAYRVVQRFGLPIRTRAEVGRFLSWMNAEGLAASTQSTILSTIRSVQPGNKALRLVQVRCQQGHWKRKSLVVMRSRRCWTTSGAMKSGSTPALPCG